MTETDLSAWLTIADAMTVLRCSKRTVERLAAAKTLEQRLRPQKGSPDVAVFSPESVAEEAQRRHPAPAPFVLPAGPTGDGNGQGSALRTHPTSVQNRDSTEALIRQFFALAVQAFQSPPSPPLAATMAETLYVTVKEAAAILGLPQADVRRLIHDGELNARMTGRGGIRIRRKDLEQL